MSFRHLVFAAIVVGVPCAAWGGPVDDAFATGYNGVSWGLPLTSLVKMLPEGDHYFSLPEGARIYSVKNDEPLLGVARGGTKVQYHFDADGRVDEIAVGIPYERHMELLLALVAQFGAYGEGNGGSTTLFGWRDKTVSITLRVSRDSHYGIAEFWIMRSASPQAGKKGAS